MLQSKSKFDDLIKRQFATCLVRVSEMSSERPEADTEQTDRKQLAPEES